MIEINLLPGAQKKSGAGTGAKVRASVESLATKIRDPFLVTAVATIVVAAALVGGLTVFQSSHRDTLAVEEQKQIEDSTRFAAVLLEKRKAEAQRDSVVRQLAVIKSIDNDRFVWPHVLEEVSRALPEYTWLTSIDQTSAVTTASAIEPVDAKDKTKKGAPRVTSIPASLPPPPPKMNFRIVGNTVDIQALTRFMTLLEASPFIQNVALEKSILTNVDGKDVTEFTLDAEYQMPDSTVIHTIPLTVSVR
jgi:Tfp pilus assembly protein PilN